jgi:broad specificity phosphatase PhoE
MPTAFLITHPDVAIDASVPVPDWPLNPRGRARMRAMLCRPWIRSVQSVFSSDERKARAGAEILAEGLGLSKYTVVTGLGENVRSASGFLNKEEFEAAVDAFFAQPHTSVRGWETAADAQARIVRAVEQVLSQAPEEQDVAMVGHGGTGTLLYCYLAGVSISRQYDQPSTNGGNWFGFDRASRHLLHAGRQLIDAM